MTIFQECIGLFLQAISTKNLNQLHFILTIHDASPSHSNLALEVSTYSKQMLQGCISRLVPVETPEFEFIHAFLLFFKEWGDKEKYTVLHKSFSQVYRSFMVWVTSTHEPWGLSLIKVLQKQLIDISKLIG
ncbi:hypothetical protein HMI56_001433 [Coelomomyces lativittatus]|nr:hypothetical protein HMI56_001433 [Coelomomyces lativittatus]